MQLKIGHRCHPKITFNLSISIEILPFLQLLDGATSTVSSMHAPPSPASSALQKLKNISFSPKKKSAQSNLSFADNRAASPRKAAAVSPERPMVKVKPDAGPKK